MIVADTSGLFAALSGAEREHAAAAAVVCAANAPLRLTPVVLAELCYLLRIRLGPEAELALVEQVCSGAYRLEPLTPEDLAEARDLLVAFADLRLGLADASVVVLAKRVGTCDLLTLDHDFRLVPGPGGRPFRLLPADA